MPLSLALVTITCTYLFSTIRYHFILRQYHTCTTPPHGSNASTGALTTLPLPYMFPWLGHTLGFVTSKPGAFWTSIQDALPAKTGGACRVVLGGQRSHLLFSTVSMAALTQNRALDRHEMSRDVGMRITGSTQYDQDLHTLPYANKSRP
ncbi:MAG: hypothetical protein Q9173_000326 [Seirophora scorigena]